MVALKLKRLLSKVLMLKQGAWAFSEEELFLTFLRPPEKGPGRCRGEVGAGSKGARW